MIETMWKFIAMLDRRERGRLALLLVLLVAMGLANMVGVGSVLPFLAVLGKPEFVHENEYLSRVYQAGGFGSHQAFVIFLAVIVVIAFVGTVLVRSGTSYAISRFCMFRAHTIAARMLSGTLRQPYSWFLSRHSADISKTILVEVTQVVGNSVMPLLNMIAAVIVAISLVALLVTVDPNAATITALVLSVSYGSLFILLRGRMRRIGQQRLNAQGERFRIGQETLASIKEIKVLGLEQTTMRRFNPASMRYADAMAAGYVITNVPSQVLEGIAFVVVITTMTTLYFLYDGDIGTLMPVAGLYAVAGVRLLPMMRQIFNGLSKIRSNKAILAHVHAEYIAAVGHHTQTEDQTSEPIRHRESLELRDLRYTYPGAERPALQGLSLKIRPKTAVGFVGGTGAGKTTAVDIILGLLTPQSGAVLVDGRPLLDEASRRRWQRSIGYVPQVIALTAGTIAENIAFGRARDEIDMTAVERAARLAQLHDFVVTRTEFGYNTEVGDRGVKLSGGQRQRIGIARALYHDPDVLVLDEATSALDTLTEAALMKALEALGGRKTVIMIAHRLSTVRKCDEIFLLEEGRLTDQGSYDELIERNPIFRHMALGAA